MNEAPIKVITEIEASDKLQSFRQRLMDIWGIVSGQSASGEHGAIVHYRATRENNAPLQRNNLYLIDSGGQYHDATTISATALLLVRLIRIWCFAIRMC